MRAIILVLDSLGVGASADAKSFGDEGADTFGHIAQACAAGVANVNRRGALSLPNLQSLGLFHAAKESRGLFPDGFVDDVTVKGAYGYASEISSGKDTPSGHWEIAGVPVLFDWGYFKKESDTFPSSLLEQFITEGLLPGVLGNCHASGITVIENFGEEHIRSGKPIVYTSADSVFQIACHEKYFGLERLYNICELARKLLEPYNIGRVIARPFTGECMATFIRTGNRRDYALKPPADTVLDKLVKAGGNVVSIGKIADIFAHQGITEKHKATGLSELFDKTIEVMNSTPEKSIIFTNFVNFDSDYGHRRDINGYANALEYFDSRLPAIQNCLKKDDLLILTADHGCDPSFPGSDHTREHIPLLVSGNSVKAGFLGGRDTFSDIGQTLADYFCLSPMSYGKSFMQFLT